MERFLCHNKSARFIKNDINLIAIMDRHQRERRHHEKAHSGNGCHFVY